ncbi:MAG TPA: M55 family metallopeptidase [Candidatus Hydrogenedentes bacterium]|nr:M55 family metallopeptidase [Candidatus Hydrogenedentota bacterium]HPO84512.1 M55 family metallopeptidase [Candidatus Hydrogenedentota bacterium]
MKIYLMTDLEGVCGVKNSVDWVHMDSRFYPQACRLLTHEVNAAASGFLEGGAQHILVADGHGDGGIDPELLDPRVEFSRGWPEGFPFGLDESFDGIAWVGQHAKASSIGAHLCHTQSFDYIDLSINGVSIGEFGQLAYCAAELGVPAFFASGDRALAAEAESLVPGIVTCWTKQGTRKDSGKHCTTPEYARWNEGAVHLSPKRACEKIRETARHAALQLGKNRNRATLSLRPPFQRVAIFRPREQGGQKTISVEEHPSSVIALMNIPFHPKPME